MDKFTHLDEQGRAVMVDVGAKERTARRAKASGSIRMNAECYGAVKRGQTQKGDVLGTARIAGIMAVKRTSSLIPLCHNLLIEQAAVEFEFDDQGYSITAECSVKTTGATGVEMEALTGVSIALLTICDMCKAMDKGMEISGIRLLEKSGGKSGTFINPRVDL
ncbi:MAG: cyclic pyranopterin monophosphate synthase MoaC [Clostridiales bacterium]|jgi:cyclic pyranopterin phosphate synthase|nr:cyclic pyranopterin monophosphate synthase MoaC [Clostridiales bacterium]